MLLSLLLIPFLSLAQATTYTLSHRYSSQPNFQTYGTIDLPSDRDINEVIRITKTLSGEIQGEGWYSVQLTGEGLGGGVVGSTKACYGPITLVIHTHPNGISSIDLTPNQPIPADGSCPTGRNGNQLNREVTMKSSQLVYGPDLSPPPPPSLSPDGKPIVPEVEKTFLQKYWLPLIGVGFFVISQMAPEDKTKPAAK